MLYQSSFEMADSVRPALAHLVVQTGETAAFYVRQVDKRVCLFRHHSPSPIRHHIDEGAEHPLNRGSDAHVMMAFTGRVGAYYDENREQGYSVHMGRINPQTGGMRPPFLGLAGDSAGPSMLLD